VTPSGRISPRQPYFHQRNTSGFSNSLDRTTNESTPKSDGCFIPTEDSAIRFLR